MPTKYVRMVNPQCTEAFNRLSALTSQGQSSVCRNQAQVLSAIDAASIACAGESAAGDLASMKSQFIAAARGCQGQAGVPPTPGQSGPYNGSAPDEGYTTPDPTGGNPALNSARADGERADQFLKAIEKCNQISDSDQRSRCKQAATNAYNGGGKPSMPAGQSGNKGEPDEDLENQQKPSPQPKDPSIDYTGMSCSYFTRPAVEDEVRMNYYSKGSCVVYGSSAYECGSDGRWIRKGPASVFKCIPAEEAESTGHGVRPWEIKKK